MESTESTTASWPAGVGEADGQFEAFRAATDQVLAGPQATLHGFSTSPFTGSSGQLQQLTAGSFHTVFPPPPAPQGYERISPVHDDYPPPSSSPGGHLLQQLQTADSHGLTGRPLVTSYLPIQMPLLLGSIPGAAAPGGEQTTPLTSLSGMLTAGHATGLYVIADTGREALMTAGVTPTIVAIDGGTQHQQQLYSVVNLPVQSFAASASEPAPLVMQLPTAAGDQVVSALDLAMQGHVEKVLNTDNFSEQAGHLQAANVATFNQLPVSESSDRFVVSDGSELLLEQLASSAESRHLSSEVQLLADSAPIMQLQAASGPHAASDDSLADMLADGVLDSGGLSREQLKLAGSVSEYKDGQTPPGVSGADEAQVRKSRRLADLEKDSTSLTPTTEYVHEKYDVRKLWCEDCQVCYTEPCQRHQLTNIHDKLVLSRAWSSLPANLQIFRFGQTSELGVFAKKTITKRTQFGPFVAELEPNKDMLTNQKFILMLERDYGTFYLETSDENKCNWMMFVRPATSYAEQNMVAYQFGTEVYFTTVKSIEARHELRVGYAAPYAAQMGVKTHKVSEDDKKALTLAELKWPCYECNEKFRTSALLQRHLQVHDDTAHVDDGVADDSDETSAGRDVKTDGQMAYRRRKARHAKKIREMVRDENGSFLSWKKKLYFNKVKRYTRGVDGAIKKPLRSLYKRKGKESGGQEWVCCHCDLTFDDPSVLNLHTLTHAAEDVDRRETQAAAGAAAATGDMPPAATAAAQTAALDEAGANVQLSEAGNSGDGGGDGGDVGGVGDGGGGGVALVEIYECPLCLRVFACKQELIEHAAEHARPHARAPLPCKPFKCSRCWKAFSVADRLARHMLCHGDDAGKPLACPVCSRRLMNNSALACHMKTHSTSKYYECPLCRAGFDQMHALREHGQTHADAAANYPCTACAKVFTSYTLVRKHMRTFHSDKQFPCLHCEKVFPRLDKLRLHMLRHSTHREFMCDSCGQQFKRKDKLKEHMRRMHHPDREGDGVPLALRNPAGGLRKFVPKVSPTDYHRFIYKCHACLLGFKRRGMLVNHLAKRHPDITPDSVPELNLPILRTQRDYYCQYCDKVYKSSSKRKAHILKNHPGAELPATARRRLAASEPSAGVADGLDICQVANANPTFSQTVGSVTTVPHSCEFCHKQYASKAKLLQHQRKKHAAPPAPGAPRRTLPQLCVSGIIGGDKHKVLSSLLLPVTAGGGGGGEEKADAGELLHIIAPPDGMPAPDLLAQAMSELQQTLSDYRPVAQTEYQRLTTAGVLLQPQQLELTQLQLNTATHFHVPPVTTTTTNGQPAQQTYLTRAWTPGQYTTYR